MVKDKIIKIKEGKLSAVANVQDSLDKIKKLNGELNAILYVNDAALEEAEAIDKKIKRKKAGRLAGLTVAVKSNINVYGLPVTCASKCLEDYYGTYDADAIRMIKEEDGIIIGMANMDEFACGSSGENSAFGPTANSAAPGMIPGGSSSGSCAAVASGICDLALGSDTGGSVRNPASHCGIVGIKPSYGRVSRFGLIDLSMSLEGIGCISKDAYGSALLMSVIAGKSDYDGTTFDTKVEDYSKFGKTSNLKIGLSSDFENLCPDKRIFSLIKNFTNKFAASTNSTVTDVRLKHVNLAVQAYYPLVYVEFFSGTRKFDGAKYGKKIEDHCGEEVLRRILGGKEISKAEHHGKYYRKALMAKRMIENDFNSAFNHADILMLPTTPVLPHKLGTKITDPRVMYAYDAFTIPANLSGVCAGVVNIGKIDNIPVGLQVMAPALREKMLFDALNECEKVAI